MRSHDQPSTDPDAAGPGDVIDRSVFVAVYVDLRAAALTTDEREITDKARAEVLSRHGASEADILGFAEYYGRDLTVMREVWDEIELLLEAQRAMMDDPGRR
jgi:hypothetical protein